MANPTRAKSEATPLESSATNQSRGRPAGICLEVMPAFEMKHRAGCSARERVGKRAGCRSNVVRRGYRSAWFAPGCPKVAVG